MSEAALRVLAAVVVQSRAVARELLNGFDFSLQQLRQLSTRFRAGKVSLSEGVMCVFVDGVVSGVLYISCPLALLITA